MQTLPEITERTPVFATPFFDIVAKRVAGIEGDPFYSLRTLDYVCIVPVTAEGRILLVRQYRPSVEAVTLELPSGHVNPGETPAQSAQKELLEETGCAAGRLEPLGCLVPDSGRLGNRLWCFYARPVVPAPNETAELEVLSMSPAELAEATADGRFTHALHLAALFLAVMQCRLPWERFDERAG